MKKYSTLAKNKSALLRPIEPSRRPTTFRQVSKYRNQSNGVGTIAAHSKYESMTNLRQSVCSRESSVSRCSQVGSPIQQFVKEKINKKIGNNSQSALTLRRPISSSVDADLGKESRLSSYSKIEGGLLDNSRAFGRKD